MGLKVQYYELNDTVGMYNKHKAVIPGERRIDRKNKNLHCGLCISQAHIVNNYEAIRIPLDAGSTQKNAYISIPNGNVLTVEAIKCAPCITPAAPVIVCAPPSQPVSPEPPDTNEPPIVTLTSPSDNAAFLSPSSVTITANASDPDGWIVKVEFYNGSVLLGTDTALPYGFTWNNVPPGTYIITARAIDNKGAFAYSAPARITVTAPGNLPPVVNITAPADGLTVIEPVDITVDIAASDPDGTIIKVDLYLDSVLVKTLTAAPYQYVWLNVPVGVHTITATAMDDDGVMAFSSMVTITITAIPLPPNVLPTVSITAPTNGTSFFAPAVIVINATAADSDGTVSQVEFYNGTTLLGSVAIAPYTFTWLNVDIGTYSITVKATDNDGGVTTSAPVTINVIPVPPPGNIPPTVAIISPITGSAYNTSSDVTVQATATDPDGTIVKVEFYIEIPMVGNVLAATDTTFPYNTVMSGIPEGTYELRAKAYDDDGASTMSAPVTITIITGAVPLWPIVPPSGTHGVFGYAQPGPLATVNEMVPFLRGWHLTFGWDDIETAAGVFDFSDFDDRIAFIISKGLKVTIMVFTGERAPAWLYSAPFSVPKVETAGGFFPYYFNPATFTASGSYTYINRWFIMLDMVRSHMATLPGYTAGNILYWQDASGKTGDFTPWVAPVTGVTINGIPQPDPSLYEISETDWVDYAHDVWTQQYDDMLPATGFMVNTGNGGENWEWATANLPDSHVKTGIFSHNYSFYGESYYATYVQGVQAAARYIRGEITFPPIGEPWWDVAPNKNTMALMVSMLHAGVSHFNIGTASYLNSATGSVAYDLFNKYAAPWLPTQTRKGFVYFRRVLDINDIVNYPEGTYGPVVNPAQLPAYTAAYNTIQANPYPVAVKQYQISRLTITYLNPARKTAMMAAFPAALFILDMNRDGDHYNDDFGCDMVPGNWNKFIRQYDQYNTCVPYWRIGGLSEYLGRYACGIPIESYFSTTLLGDSTCQATLTIHYYNGAAGVLQLNYYNGTIKTSGGTITTTNTGIFISQTFIIPDLRGGGHLADGNDFSLEWISGAVIILGLLEIEIAEA